MTREEFLIELSNFDPGLPTHFHNLECGLKPHKVVLEYTANTAILKWPVPGHAKKSMSETFRFSESTPVRSGSTIHRARGKQQKLWESLKRFANMKMKWGQKFEDHCLSDAKRYDIEAMCQTVDWLEAIEEFTRKAAIQLKIFTGCSP